MGRPKKTEYDEITKQVCYFVGKTGFVSRKVLQERFDLDDKKYHMLVRNNYFKKIQSGSEGEGVNLGTRGDRLFSEVFYDEKKYGRSSSRHDGGLSEVASKLSDSEIASIKTADEFREYLKEEGRNDGGKNGKPDLVYYCEEVENWVGLEVITRNYKMEEVSRKIEWCREVGIEYRIVDIDGTRNFCSF